MNSIIIFLILFLFFSVRRPLWAGIFILSTLPSYLVRFYFFAIPATLLEGMIWCFVIGSLWKNQVGLKFFNIASRRALILQKRNLFFIIFVIFFLFAGLISAFQAPEFHAALGIFKAYIVESILFVLLFLLLLKNNGNVSSRLPNARVLQILLYTLGITTFIISLYALFQKITGFGIPNAFWQASETRRVTSVFEYPNALGLYLGPLVVLYFGIFVNQIKTVILRHKVSKDLMTEKSARFAHWILRYAQDDKKTAFLSFLVFVFAFLAIFFAKSEGAIFGILTGMMIIIFFSFPTIKQKKWFLFLGTLGVATLFFVPITREYLIQKVSLNDFSGNIRREMWNETFAFLKTEPFFGAGLSGYQDRIMPFHTNTQDEVFLYPHNFFLNFYVEMGILGLVSVIGLLSLFFIRVTRRIFSNDLQQCTVEHSKKMEPLSFVNIFFFAMMVEILVHGMVDAPFFKNDLSIIFLFILFSGIHFHLFFIQSE